ncbi:unnamed protein product [Caenorhabditis auriculariae]|uniref:Uncharacterized protein n=1 Tax=Caenorhabditis auriculariae TaxID=2777116 RepID=A0A8S1HB23_9PELO|nr:unnamed protein product [Caenorhabditis auriculariae]
MRKVHRPGTFMSLVYAPFKALKSYASAIFTSSCKECGAMLRKLELTRKLIIYSLMLSGAAIYIYREVKKRKDRRIIEEELERIHQLEKKNESSRSTEENIGEIAKDGNDTQPFFSIPIFENIKNISDDEKKRREDREKDFEETKKLNKIEEQRLEAESEAREIIIEQNRKAMNFVL